MKHHVVFHDLKNTIKRINIAFILAWYDIKLRYRRTRLGLIWISITVLIESFILSMVFSHLFHERFIDYYPYVFSGRVSWQFIAGILGESIKAVPGAKNYILNHNIPPPVFILRICLRNFLIFMHSSIFVLAVCCLNGINVWFYGVVFILPMMALWLIFLLFPFALILSILGARYRDIIFLMPYCMQILFYLTPIVWKSKNLSGSFAHFLAFNPFAYMIEMMRDIFFYSMLDYLHLVHLLMFSFVGWIVAFFMYASTHKKLCYWML